MTPIEQKLFDYFSRYPLVRHKGIVTLIQPGQEVTSLYFLTEGTVKMSLMLEDGEELIIHLFKPPAIFPWMVLATDQTNRFSFITTASCAYYKAPAQEALEAFKQDADVYKELLSRFAKAIDGLTTRLEISSTYKQQHQLLSLLKFLAIKFGEPYQNGHKITIKLTHQELANWLGTARETVTKQISQLHRDKYIDYHNKQIVVVDSTPPVITKNALE